MAERQFSMNVGGIVLSSPCFFPSISNVKTNLSPLEYLRILIAVDHPLFLVSAYDIYHASPKDRVAIRRLLKRSYQSKTIILLDSGNYEAYWGKDKKWNRTNFASVLKMQLFHLGFCYDNQHPPISIKAIVSDVEHTAQSKWVDWEIRESIALGKGVVAMHKGDAPPLRLPPAITEHKIPLVPWNQRQLARAIERVVKE